MCTPGWSLPGAELDEGLRLPTFTRAIPRKKPPPNPAGIHQCDDQTLRRWKGDEMKFPPYTYQPQFLFRHRDSGDVRLDLGIVFRPDSAPRTSIDPSRWIWTVAHAWPYRQEEHINILELRAILHTLEWRARGAGFQKVRFLHLADSQICLAVLTKGRSSSRKLNRLLQKICALALALNVYPLWAWVESRLNPADGPSRRFEDAKKD